MNPKELLNGLQWEKPDCYAGFSPDGDYVIATQHRDSDVLERSNYQRIFEDLQEINDQCQTDDDEPFVYDFRASHWAVGWVEYLLVKQNAPLSVLIKAANIVSALESYPVYDEEHCSMLEDEELNEQWEGMSVQDRFDAIKDSGSDASIFSARHDSFPYDDNGSLECWLRG